MADASTATLIQLTRDAIETRLTGGAVRSYTIGDRDLSYEPLPNLIRLLHAMQEVQAGEEGMNVAYAQFDRKGGASTTE